MHMENVVNERSTQGAALGVPVDLSLLERLTSRELDALYRRAKVPASIDVLNGAPRGRMLALVPPLDRGIAFAGIQAFASSRFFPWGGKSFATGSTEGRGTGINRAVLLGNIFEFDTFIAPSAVDGQPAIILDYDKPSNPWFIRKIHDELREVAENLYLGPAMWKAKAGPKLVLHFAIETSPAH